MNPTWNMILKKAGLICLSTIFCFCLLILFYSNYVKERELRNILEFKDQLIRQEYQMVRQMQLEHTYVDHVFSVTVTFPGGMKGKKG